MDHKEEIIEDKDKDESLGDFLDQFFLEKRTIFLFGDIENGLAKRTIQQLLYLKETKGDIILNICSDGGAIESQNAIIDTIELCKKEVDVCICAIGKCFSAGANILTFGTKGKRVATANTTIMFHPISYDLPLDYISKQQSFSDYSKIESERITEAVAKNIGKKKKDWGTLIEDGLWLSPKEALKLKVIDEII